MRRVCMLVAVTAIALSLGAAGSVLAFRRLRGIGAQEAIFEGCAIEAADDGLHLIGRRCFDEGEAFRFLSFVVADHLYRIGDEIFGG